MALAWCCAFVSRETGSGSSQVAIVEPMQFFCVLAKLRGHEISSRHCLRFSSVFEREEIAPFGP